MPELFHSAPLRLCVEVLKIACLHAARNTNACSDSCQDSDKRLNHNLPNFSLFHNYIYNLPFTKYYWLISPEFPPIPPKGRGRVKMLSFHSLSVSSASEKLIMHTLFSLLGGLRGTFTTDCFPFRRCRRCRHRFQYYRSPGCRCRFPLRFQSW